MLINIILGLLQFPEISSKMTLLTRADFVCLDDADSRGRYYKEKPKPESEVITSKGFFLHISKRLKGQTSRLYFLKFNRQ